MYRSSGNGIVPKLGRAAAQAKQSCFGPFVWAVKMSQSSHVFLSVKPVSMATTVWRSEVFIMALDGGGGGMDWLSVVTLVVMTTDVYLVVLLGQTCKCSCTSLPEYHPLGVFVPESFGTSGLWFVIYTGL